MEETSNPRLAGLRLEEIDGDLVIYVEGIEISRTSLAEGIMQAEQLWHYLREAARKRGEPGE